MRDPNVSLLGYALLGLLQSHPHSGYDLRKFFSATPLRTFSDSPGSIYPALRRLEQGGLIRSQVQERTGLRRRRVFRPTAAGLETFQNWQRRPIVRDDIVRGIDELMLRFSFMDRSLGRKASQDFLRSLRRELTAYLPTLHEFLAAHGESMPDSGRLALESGIHRYESLLRWARGAIASYEKGGRKK